MVLKLSCETSFPEKPIIQDQASPSAEASMQRAKDNAYAGWAKERSGSMEPSRKKTAVERCIFIEDIFWVLASRPRSIYSWGMASLWSRELLYWLNWFCLDSIFHLSSIVLLNFSNDLLSYLPFLGLFFCMNFTSQFALWDTHPLRFIFSEESILIHIRYIAKSLLSIIL